MEPIHILATKTIQYCDHDGSLNIIITCEEIKEILKRTTVLEDKEGTCILYIHVYIYTCILCVHVYVL